MFVQKQLGRLIRNGQRCAGRRRPQLFICSEGTGHLWWRCRYFKERVRRDAKAFVKRLAMEWKQGGSICSTTKDQWRNSRMAESLRTFFIGRQLSKPWEWEQVRSTSEGYLVNEKRPLNRPYGSCLNRPYGSCSLFLLYYFDRWQFRNFY